MKRLYFQPQIEVNDFELLTTICFSTPYGGAGSGEGD